MGPPHGEEPTRWQQGEENEKLMTDQRYCPLPLGLVGMGKAHKLLMCGLLLLPMKPPWSQGPTWFSLSKHRGSPWGRNTFVLGWVLLRPTGLSSVCSLAYFLPGLSPGRLLSWNLVPTWKKGRRMWCRIRAWQQSCTWLIVSCVLSSVCVFTRETFQEPSAFNSWSLGRRFIFARYQNLCKSCYFCIAVIFCNLFGAHRARHPKISSTLKDQWGQELALLNHKINNPPARVLPSIWVDLESSLGWLLVIVGHSDFELETVLTYLLTSRRPSDADLLEESFPNNSFVQLWMDVVISKSPTEKKAKKTLLRTCETWSLFGKQTSDGRWQPINAHGDVMHAAGPAAAERASREASDHCRRPQRAHPAPLSGIHLDATPNPRNEKSQDESQLTRGCQSRLLYLMTLSKMRPSDNKSITKAKPWRLRMSYTQTVDHERHLIKCTDAHVETQRNISKLWSRNPGRSLPDQSESDAQGESLKSQMTCRQTFQTKLRHISWQREDSDRVSFQKIHVKVMQPIQTEPCKHESENRNVKTEMFTHHTHTHKHTYVYM